MDMKNRVEFQENNLPFFCSKQREMQVIPKLTLFLVDGDIKTVVLP